MRDTRAFCGMSVSEANIGITGFLDPVEELVKLACRYFFKTRQSLCEMGYV